MFLLFSVGFFVSQFAFVLLKCVPFILFLYFIQEGMMNFVKRLCIYWEQVISASLICITYCINWSVYVELSMNLWMKPTWSWWVSFVKCSSIQFENYFVDNFCNYVHYGDLSIISLYCCISIWFGYESNVSFVKIVVVFLPFLFNILAWKLQV